MTDQERFAALTTELAAFRRHIVRRGKLTFKEVERYYDIRDEMCEVCDRLPPESRVPAYEEAFSGSNPGPRAG